MAMSTTVPDDYRGVWTCTQVHALDSSGHTDPNTAAAPAGWSRWVQTGQSHAHLRLPADALALRQPLPLDRLSPQQLAALTHQQAHVGDTQVQEEPEGELCTWLHRADYQPPSLATDAAWMMFHAPDRVWRIPLQGDVTEVWERLPDSLGRFRCLAGLDAQGHDDGRRVLVAGAYAMHARLRPIAWPRGMRPGLSLAEAMMHRPDQALHWLDQELSFGRCEAGRWTIEHSTLPALEGRSCACQVVREPGDVDHAWVEVDGHSERWRVLEWSDV
jgi:hypothetical protein